MAVFHDPSGVYTIDGDDTRRYADATSFQINGKDVFRFDPETGVLKLSADEAVIAAITQQCEGFPIKELAFALPIAGTMRFHHVTAVESLPQEDGSFLLTI